VEQQHVGRGGERGWVRGWLGGGSEEGWEGVCSRGLSLRRRGQLNGCEGRVGGESSGVCPCPCESGVGHDTHRQPVSTVRHLCQPHAQPVGPTSADTPPHARSGNPIRRHMARRVLRELSRLPLAICSTSVESVHSFGGLGTGAAAALGRRRGDEGVRRPWGLASAGVARYVCFTHEPGRRDDLKPYRACRGGRTLLGLRFSWLAEPLVMGRMGRGMAGDGKPQKPFKASDYNVIEIDDHLARVDGYGKEGFLVNGVEYHGSLLMYGSMSLVWSARTPADITVDRCAPRLQLPSADPLPCDHGTNACPSVGTEPVCLHVSDSYCAACARSLSLFLAVRPCPGPWSFLLHRTRWWLPRCPAAGVACSLSHAYAGRVLEGGHVLYSDAQNANRTGYREIAHAAVSGRPPISLSRIVARTEGYAYVART
jgi:hypothetical protein